MAYDLDEQEQIENLKAWWKTYGTYVVLAVTAFALTVLSIQGWRYYTAQQAQRAASLYVQLDQAQTAQDFKRVRDIAAQIVDRYPRTHYAGMAALAAAHASFATGEMDEARRHLQWAAERAREAEMRDVARLRLAGVLLDRKQHEEALKVLAMAQSNAYGPLFADARGDVLAASGQPAEARAAYQSALEKSDPQSAYRRVIEVKLDALGDVK
jgi:predicted negative regulator of RcsB-dependent stress response